MVDFCIHARCGSLFPSETPFPEKPPTFSLRKKSIPEIHRFFPQKKNSRWIFTSMLDLHIHGMDVKIHRGCEKHIWIFTSMAWMCPFSEGKRVIF